MWLINATTYQLEAYDPEQCPPYAILSHRWQTEEVTFHDMKNLATARKKAGFRKIQGMCAKAIAYRLEYAWVDTCCINKESSAELSEAINSMFGLYRDAKVCFVYLCDVHRNPIDDAEFRRSEWFLRGWTLQELIAPKDLHFFNSAWNHIANKIDIVDLLSDITWIEVDALRGQDLAEFIVVTKMRWASRRKTTRREDIAYCLLGIFGVNLPLLYGEGDKAFMRLQHEIIRCVDDGTIFAWKSNTVGFTGLLADSPAQFQDFRLLVQDSLDYFTPRDIALTNRGLSVLVHAAVYSPGIYRMSTGCYDIQTGNHFAIYLHRPVLSYHASPSPPDVFRRIHLPDLSHTYSRENTDVWNGMIFKGGLKTTTYQDRVHVPMKILVPQHFQHLFGTDSSRTVVKKLSRFEIRVASNRDLLPLIPMTSRTIDKGVDGHIKEFEAYTQTGDGSCYGLMLSYKFNHPKVDSLYLGFVFSGLPVLIVTLRQQTQAETVKQASIINEFLTGRVANQYAWHFNRSERSTSVSQGIWNNCGGWLEDLDVGEQRQLLSQGLRGGVWIMQASSHRERNCEYRLPQEDSFLKFKLHPSPGDNFLLIADLNVCGNH